jgi:hypothetical protein
MNSANNNNREIRAVRQKGIRKCYWLADPEFVEPDASSQANFSVSGEKCIEVNLSGLSKEKRRPVWEWIQEHDPDLAALLAEDESFKAIKDAFNCAVKVQIPTSVCRQLGLIR